MTNVINFITFAIKLKLKLILNMSSNCRQCIIKRFNALKTLTPEELEKFSDHKTSIVIKKGDTIKSSDFDHKNPPFELKQLVEHILSIKEN